MKQKKKRSLWKRLGIVAGIGVILLALAVVAFVFNPLEGSVRSVRDLVPREAQVFLRKTELAGDFRDFPEPAFWSDFAGSKAWEELQKGPLVQQLKRDGFERSLQQVREMMQQARAATHGFVDPLTDLLGREIVIAGYFEDLSGPAPKPLAAPYWCLYARVSWKLRAAWGLLRWSIVQSQAQKGGLSLSSDGDFLVVKPPNGETLYAGRHLDCLMVTNHKHMLEQSMALAIGAEGEEPFGTAAHYTEAVVQPLVKWAEATGATANAVEFSIEPNRLDAFSRFSATWPNAADPESMNQRVLASFLNFKGWSSIGGALMFEPDRVSLLGRVVLDSHKHTAFQSSFFKAEQEARSKWLDPFLKMVPQSACAAAALRMPAGEFMDRMYAALSENEKAAINLGISRAPWDGQQLADARDLIDRIKPALLSRTGFVFRKNVPDPGIAVAAISPIPQVAWVFWIRDGSAPLVEAVLKWARQNATTLNFQHVYHLKMNLSGEASAATGDEGGEDVVTEFTNPQIDGTGELATVLFRDFFVLSNSGPLIKDMFAARYNAQGVKSVYQSDAMAIIDRELPQALNGFLYVSGPQLMKLFDSYRDYIGKSNLAPDPVWMMQIRPTAEETVRKARFPSRPTVASMTEQEKADFERLIGEWMNTEWKKATAGVTPDDVRSIEQLHAFARGIDAAYLQVQLENNYIRFQGKVLTDLR
jgi:hypothetical protein